MPFPHAIIHFTCVWSDELEVSAAAIMRYVARLQTRTASLRVPLGTAFPPHETCFNCFTKWKLPLPNVRKFVLSDAT